MEIAYFKVHFVYLGIYFMSFSWYIPFEGCGGPVRTKIWGGDWFYYVLLPAAARSSADGGATRVVTI